MLPRSLLSACGVSQVRTTNPVAFFLSLTFQIPQLVMSHQLIRCGPWY